MKTKYNKIYLSTMAIFISYHVHAENSTGKYLDKHGIDPILDTAVVYQNSGNMGQEKMSTTHVVMSIGANFDLSKLANIDDTQIHFNQAYIPVEHNSDFAGRVGGSIIDDPTPYVIRSTHLQRFTIQKQFMDKKYDFEFGKDSASIHFAKPLCGTPYGCQSTLLHLQPTLYPMWGGRMKYSINNDWYTQAGQWNYYPPYPLLNGWDLDEPFTGKTKLANLVYEPADGKKRLEFLVYNNSATQYDPLTNETHKGTNGFYVGGKTEIYSGKEFENYQIPNVSVFEQYTQSMDPENTKGTDYTNVFGFLFSSPIKSRPMDNYALEWKTLALTSDEQQHLNNSMQSSGFTDYNNSKFEHTVEFTANIFLTNYLIVSPMLQYSWNVNTKNSATYNEKPRDGFSVAILGIVLFDKILGL